MAEPSVRVRGRKGGSKEFECCSQIGLRLIRQGYLDLDITMVTNIRREGAMLSVASRSRLTGYSINRERWNSAAKSALLRTKAGRWAYNDHKVRIGLLQNGA